MVDTEWTQIVSELGHEGTSFTLITLLGVRGSAPRETGTKMIVTAERSYLTIGGGHLEYKSIQIARQMLADETDQMIENFPLGPALGQCCGGSTSVLFERFVSPVTHIMLFGAGHVGRCVAKILADLPCKVRWVDSREEAFPTVLPGNIETTVSDTPADEVADMPADSFYLVMTHNHQMDFDICLAILNQATFHYFGLIGSATKWSRFKQRFIARGFQLPEIERIRCPVGLADVPGKRPMEVAVSITGEIINAYQHLASLDKVNSKQQGISWRELKAVASATGKGEPRE